MQSMTTRHHLSKSGHNLPYPVDCLGMPISEQGQPTERVGGQLGPRGRHEYPYSHDGYLQFKKVDTLPPNTSAKETDRMLDENYTRFRQLSEKHFKNERDPGGEMYFGSRSPAAIEGFLRDFYNDPGLELLRIEEHRNRSSGHMLWAFFFTHAPGWTYPDWEALAASEAARAQSGAAA